MTISKIKDIMTAHPFMIKPSQSIDKAARLMKEIDCGVLPVGEPDDVVGVITDRDITLRVTAEGKDPSSTKVEDIMTKGVHCCKEDDDIEEAAKAMRKHGVARLVVMKNDKATGIVTMGCLLQNCKDSQQEDATLHTLLQPKSAKKA